jgi:histidinol-phosphate aminotransferase
MPLPDDILRPHLAAVTYTPVKPLDVLALEIGIPEGRLIKLDANENLYGPLPCVRAAMDGVDMHIYPDPSQHRLKHALSQLHGCSTDALVVGAGSDEVGCNSTNFNPPPPPPPSALMLYDSLSVRF